MTGPVSPHQQGQVLDQTVVVADAATAPVHGLFQPYFPLSHVDFVRLQGTSNLLDGLGAGVITFAVTYGLPLFVTQLQSGPKLQAADWWIVGGGIAAGFVLIVIARVVSSHRRVVLKRIDKHFTDNPGQQEFRMGAP